MLDGVVGSFVSRSFNISGTVGTGAGSYAQFGGEMDFYSVIGGTATSLGSLTFNYINLSGGPFATTVTGSGIIGPSIPFNNPDFIRVTERSLSPETHLPSTWNQSRNPPAWHSWALPRPTLLGFRRRRSAA